MSFEEKRAFVKATNKESTVYHLRDGDWCDSSDLRTKYNKKELIFKPNKI